MRTDRGLDRFITFLDAVVAIALTLLVLPLADVASDAVRGESLGTIFAEHLGELASFLLSFAVIARFWVAHHKMVEWVARYDAAFVRTNLVWVFALVLLPFSTALTSASGAHPGVPAFYVGNVLLLLLAQSLAVTHVVRHPHLQRTTDDPSVEVRPGDSLAAIRDGTVVSAALVAIALAVVLLRPDARYATRLLLLGSGPVERLRRRAQRRRTAARGRSASGR